MVLPLCQPWMDTRVLWWLTFPSSVHQPGCFMGCQEVCRAQLSPGARPQVSSGLPPLLNFSVASSRHFLGLFRSFLCPLPVIPLASSGSFSLVVQILSQTSRPFSLCLSSVSTEPATLVPLSPWDPFHVTARLSKTSRGQGPLLADTYGKVRG